MAAGKWIAGLTPDMPIADAAKIVFAERFAVVRHFLPLAAEKPDDDIEYVHQLRVGTRRCNAALRVFAAALPRKPLKEFKTALRTIRHAAGDARDWDVFLIGLPNSSELVKSKSALVFLTGYAFGQRTASQARLAEVAAETGPRFVEECEALPARILAPDEDDAPPNFGALAGRHLGLQLKEMSRAVEANPSDPTELHALRIMAKRLRYAIEIFADCFPPVLKQQVYPAVEQVQETLGEVQDAVVGIARLTHIRASVQARMPKKFTRVKHGIDSFAASLKAKIPAGITAFAAWRSEWLELISALKLEVLAATVTA